jgi:L-ascorbate metabolism protein UlaG (beta-lactamase superfamily)
MARISRRKAIALGAGAVLAAAGTAEYLSLSGRFDHRRALLPAKAAHERWGESIATLERAPATAALVHVAHSTHLIALGGLRLLTDPWWYDPAFGALSHEVAPAIEPEGVGRLDAILVTHDHADHADLRALDRMDKRAVVLTSTNDLAARIRARGFGDVAVLAPWEERKLVRDATSISVTAVPGLHDIYEIGFVVRGADKSVYFAGDSRLHPDLPAIAERLAPDVAILSVDGTRLAGGQLHVMTPEDAVTATKTLKSKLVFPSHAEAVFSDPLAEHLLASTIPRARFAFADLVARDLPGVSCKVPNAGELVPL